MIKRPSRLSAQGKGSVFVNKLSLSINAILNNRPHTVGGAEVDTWNQREAWQHRYMSTMEPSRALYLEGCIEHLLTKNC